ncbi:permease prefix domain 1-containing protein [Pseudonocardia asaccharolytica]|uniref:Uncharacterized protein n=1 Tax=Pseudonocardia asaccharolytica DSM 44247 = NBRC 16224 TaxID=1123024 RepID=A0A511D5E1_9PSEU|nr:permease prefix domain 1-containing protein [Pseudonocardia asaccharolytica]GEL18804.1 hypothetical protein PA7_26410 [Pseudonocardia asaccharolytica DSM 44247 = NBRC 16224]
MAGPGLILNPVARRILEAWLCRLDAALPGPARLRERIVDELRDGLHSAAEHRLDAGTDPVDAATAAVAEFGDPDTLAASFRGELAAHLARRAGIALVASGPLVGLAWLAALAPPPWPPRPAGLLGTHPLYLAVLAVAVPAALLAVAATGRLGRRLPRHPALAAHAAAVAALACTAGDGLLLVVLAHTALAAPATLAWPTALLAAVAGSARLGLTARAAHRCVESSPAGS